MVVLSVFFDFVTVPRRFTRVSKRTAENSFTIRKTSPKPATRSAYETIRTFRNPHRPTMLYRNAATNNNNIIVERNLRPSLFPGTIRWSRQRNRKTTARENSRFFPRNYVKKKKRNRRIFYRSHKTDNVASGLLPILM